MLDLLGLRLSVIRGHQLYIWYLLIKASFCKLIGTDIAALAIDLINKLVGQILLLLQLLSL